MFAPAAGRRGRPAADRLASAAEVRVMISGGLSAAYNTLVPAFEKATGQQGHHGLRALDGHHRQRHSGAARTRRTADVLIMVGYALDDLAKNGKVIPDSRVELVKSASASRSRRDHRIPTSVRR